jgi:hypothetical protein
LKKWSNVWPFLGAVFLFICNVDWVIAPALGSYMDSFWAQYFTLVVLANLELFGWYYFWRWFFVSFLPERRKIRETIDFTKEVAQELQQKGYKERFVEHFERTFDSATNPENDFFRKIKAWGHAGMIFLGFEPFITGGRLAGVILCSTAKWKTGLYSLMVGNSIHVFVTMGSWNLIFYVWERYKIIVIFLVFLSALFMSRGFVWKKIKQTQTEPKSP